MSRTPAAPPRRPACAACAAVVHAVGGLLAQAISALRLNSQRWPRLLLSPGAFASSPCTPLSPSIHPIQIHPAPAPLVMPGHSRCSSLHIPVRFSTLSRHMLHFLITTLSFPLQIHPTEAQNERWIPTTRPYPPTGILHFLASLSCSSPGTYHTQFLTTTPFTPILQVHPSLRHRGPEGALDPEHVRGLHDCGDCDDRARRRIRPTGTPHLRNQECRWHLPAQR